MCKSQHTFPFLKLKVEDRAVEKSLDGSGS